MRDQGWIDDETAVRLAFKFAGENLGQEQIDAILRSGVRDQGSGEKEQDGGSRD
jgi:hypothetical protein